MASIKTNLEPTKRRADVLADRIEEGAGRLATFVEGLSEAQWRQPVSATDRRPSASSSTTSLTSIRSRSRRPEPSRAVRPSRRRGPLSRSSMRNMLAPTRTSQRPMRSRCSPATAARLRRPSAPSGTKTSIARLSFGLSDGAPVTAQYVIEEHAMHPRVASPGENPGSRRPLLTTVRSRRRSPARPPPPEAPPGRSRRASLQSARSEQNLPGRSTTATRGEARKTASGAMSAKLAGTPERRLRDPILLKIASGEPGRVESPPSPRFRGLIEFTRIFLGPSSFARTVRHRARCAALVARQVEHAVRRRQDTRERPDVDHASAFIAEELHGFSRRENQPQDVDVELADGRPAPRRSRAGQTRRCRRC